MRKALGAAGALAITVIAAAPLHASAAQRAPNQVTGVVWQDTNADGIRTDDEPLLSGVTVELKDLKGGTYDDAVTDANGAYLLVDPRVEGRTDDPPPDPMRDYRIKVTPPAGMTLTKPGAGNDPARDSDIDPATGQSEPGRCEADGCDGADAGLVPN